MANKTFASKKQGSLEYPLINPSNRRKGEPVQVQCDNEECLQDNARRMDEAFDGYRDKRKWNWT